VQVLLTAVTGVLALAALASFGAVVLFQVMSFQPKRQRHGPFRSRLALWTLAKPWYRPELFSEVSHRYRRFKWWAFLVFVCCTFLFFLFRGLTGRLTASP
jgi:hypothetical protein